MDLAQIHALEDLVPTLAADAVAISGDLTQRARHGEFQRALALVRRLHEVAPTLVVPGNHDVEWWWSPFGIAGRGPLYRKYRTYFGDDLTPTLSVPGAILAGGLSAYGVAFGSMTPNPNDMAVKGHLPASETDRLAAVFRQAPTGVVRIAVVHHNVLRGDISGRMGLAHWRDAQARLAACGADLVLCGHDHQESAGLLAGTVPVVASGTHTSRSRGGRPSAFPLVRVGSTEVRVEFQCWDAAAGEFRPGPAHAFPRRAAPRLAVPAGSAA